MSLMLAPFYAILDPEQTKGRAPTWVLRQLLDGGAKILQLRVKSMAPREYWTLAQDARTQTRAAGCQLIVNDRIDIALACDADGVHLGQEDLPLGVGRKLMGDKIIGISTHNLEQAKEAQQNRADYIGFGPIFSTTTKETGFSARGIAMLQEIRAAVNLPIVAIGGITEENVQQTWQAGADSAAIISGVLCEPNIIAKITRIVALQGTHSAPTIRQEAT